MGTLRDTQAKVIKKHFLDQMDERTTRLRDAAIWDLHFGPFTAEFYKESHELADWPGYVSALEHLENWASQHVVEVWVDEDGDLSTTEPAPETTDDGEVLALGEWTLYDRRSVKSIVFGKLVSDGGMS